MFFYKDFRTPLFCITLMLQKLKLENLDSEQ